MANPLSFSHSIGSRGFSRSVFGKVSPLPLGEGTVDSGFSNTL
jgi:hypothetical protein